ncbi:MAG: hypothetical protein NDI77_07230 [Geobacteraceae bacterium]|nr:hypothetical protein [Geobacteraceae bacterium]
MGALVNQGGHKTRPYRSTRRTNSEILVTSGKAEWVTNAPVCSIHLLAVKTKLFRRLVL